MPIRTLCETDTKKAGLYCIFICSEWLSYGVSCVFFLLEFGIERSLNLLKFPCKLNFNIFNLTLFPASVIEFIAAIFLGDNNERKSWPF